MRCRGKIKWRDGASKVCRHPVYDNVQVLSVACDGIVECWQGVDEKDCKQNDVWILLGTLIAGRTIYELVF